MLPPSCTSQPVMNEAVATGKHKQYGFAKHLTQLRLGFPSIHHRIVISRGYQIMNLERKSQITGGREYKSVDIAT